MAPVGDPYGNARGRSSWKQQQQQQQRPIVSHRFIDKKKRVPHKLPTDNLTRLLLGTSQPAISGENNSQKKKNPTEPLIVSNYALQLVDLCRSAGKRHHALLAAWNTVVLLCTVFAVLAAVWYGHTAEDSLLAATAHQWVLFAATVVLPCLTVWSIQSRKALVSRGNPFPEVQARVESEIFYFRARVSPYKKHAMAEKLLLDKLEGIYRKYVLDTGHSLSLEDGFWKLDDEGEQSLATKPELEIKEAEQQIPSPTSTLDFDATLYACLPFLPSSTNSSQSEADIEAPAPPSKPNEHTPLLVSKKETSDDIEGSKKPKALEEDDRRSQVTPHEYQVLRLEKLLSQQSQKVERLTQQKRQLETVASFLTLSTSAMALASLQWAVPMVLALAAGASQVMELTGLGRQYEQAMVAHKEFCRIEHWWKTVSLDDQGWQLRQLVQETEAAAVAAGD